MPHIFAAYKQYYKAENTPRLTSEHPEHTPVLQNGPSVGDLDSQKSFRGSTSTEDLCAGHLRSARPCFGAHAPKCDIFCYGPWIIQKQNVLNTRRMEIYYSKYVSSAMQNTDIVRSFDDAQKGFLWTDFRSISTRLHFCCGGEYLGGTVRQEAKCTQPERHWWLCDKLRSSELRSHSESGHFS